MLSIPHKKTTNSNQNVIAPLEAYIKNNFGKQQHKESLPALQRIQASRKAFVNAYAEKESDALEKTCMNYHGIVQRLEAKFPYGANTAGYFANANRVQIDFTWYDAFDPHNKKKIKKSNNLGIEKAAINR
eukprot:UN04358